MKLMIKLLTVGVAACFLAACNKSEPVKVPDPVAFDKHDRCLICGMVILNYPGAKAQVYIEGTKEPLKFCSVKDGFIFSLQPENAKRLQAFYVSDFANKEEKPLHQKMLNAKNAIYVSGSDVRGAMGKSILPFATQSQAEQFQKEHGGTILKYNEVTLEQMKALKGQ